MSHRTPARSLRFRNRWAIRCLALTLALASVPAAQAARDSASLTVGATVREWARIDANRSPTQLVITQDDVSRGWVELADATSLVVRTNSKTGYVLRLCLQPDPASFAELVSEPGRPVFSAGCGDLVRETAEPTREELSLSWRLHLGSDAEPGTYPWPLTVSAHPR